MVKAYKIKVEPMTKESFGPFGELVDPRERPLDRRIVSPLDFHAEGRTTLSSIWQPCEGLTFCEMERHFKVTQTFFQLSGSPTVVAAAAPTDEDPLAIPEPGQISAFLIDPSKGYSFKVGTWHSLKRFVLAPPGATLAVINSDPNPSQVVNYQDNLSLTYTDLGTDKNPSRDDLGNRFGLVFELTL
ncbi:MAG: ureidoglycolate lyase [Dehalococcoidia bacterium]|jgi:ureidoglycolate hydrolase|nr:ureidoglycolate lyase [Dehalococcoidia bacterium]MDP6226461.1 ureidoglycolate lyase [Dehalococcoidia bacterium]MDP7085751.1 ureidoglycolate lyase [Dehalococcoidia bacterium]|tara:strand:- start:236 stop:793 length:558 start_codon:yes stop_codon:yes gene_type:complete